MSTMYCMTRTFVGRLGLVEKDSKTRQDFDPAELGKFPRKCFAKLIHKALHGVEIVDEDVDDPDEWPELVFVKTGAIIEKEAAGFRGRVVAEEWCAGCGPTKAIAMDEFNWAYQEERK